MKKLLALTLTLLLAFSLFACNAAAPDGGDTDGDGSGAADPVDIRIAALKGPTAMGMVKMIEDSKNGLTANNYNATIYGTADEVSALLISGDIDVAAVPANLASILYNKTEGKVKVAAINTLGVLYVVENGDSINSIEDLRGKTVYSTGQGTTPEFALNYVLRENGLDPETDLTIECKTESTEIAALLGETNDDVIAVLPQPYVTTVMMQNESVRIALDLTKEWDAVSDSSTLVTGVLVATAEFIETNPDAFAQLLADYTTSVDYVNGNPAEAALLIEALDIVKAPVAEAAIPYCNIVLITGDEMKQKLGGYLDVLYAQDPKSVGGALPDEAFYYTQQ